MLPSPFTKLAQRLAEEGDIVVDVKVIPRAPVSQVAGWMSDGALKVKVNAAPEKGRANEEVCAVLAEYFGVSKRNVDVITGHTSPRKRVRIRRD